MAKDHKKAMRESKARKRATFLAYKLTLSCIYCGEAHPTCLDFHHRNPAEKVETVSNIFNTRGLKALWDEIAKCDVICANCHRKLHSNI